MVKQIFLIYHAILPSLDQISDLYYEDPIYTLSIDQFKMHLEIIKKFQKIKNNIDPILTFDDGHISSYIYIFPLLAKNQIRAFFFPVCSLINKKNFLSSSMIIEMLKMNMKFGSHGMTHRYFTSLTDKELFYELDYSKKFLEDITGEYIGDLSCPGGRFDKRTINFAKKIGYRRIYTSKPEIIYRKKYLTGRICIKQCYSAKEIQNFLEGKILKLKLKYYILSFLKKIFGSYYEPIRNLITVRRFL